jgi:hypothetical protein
MKLNRLAEREFYNLGLIFLYSGLIYLAKGSGSGRVSSWYVFNFGRDTDFFLISNFSDFLFIALIFCASRLI